MNSKPTLPTFKIAALGDSITSGCNAELLGDNLRYSWSTGNADSGGLRSHLHRLRTAFTQLNVTAINVAVAGSQAAALAEQVDLILSYQPDYVTLLMGANDLPKWMLGEYGVLLERYAADMGAAIKRLVAANGRVMVQLVAIPNQARVLQILQRSPIQSGSFFQHINRGYQERRSRMNAALEHIANTTPGNVRFAGNVAFVQFSEEHLSPIDRYHPSIAGQALLADASWQMGFFP